MQFSLLSDAGIPQTSRLHAVIQSYTNVFKPGLGDGTMNKNGYRTETENFWQRRSETRAQQFCVLDSFCYWWQIERKTEKEIEFENNTDENRIFTNEFCILDERLAGLFSLEISQSACHPSGSSLRAELRIVTVLTQNNTCAFSPVWFMTNSI